MEVCRSIQERVTSQVEETVERWENQIQQICEDLPWPLDWFCHAVTVLVKVVDTIIVAVVSVVTRVVCESVGYALNAVGGALNAVLHIPLVGGIVRFVVGASSWFASAVTGAIDFGAGLLGIRPTKQLTLDVIVLRDEEGVPLVDTAALSVAIATATQTWRERAHIAMKANTFTAPTPALHVALTVDSNAGLFAEDATMAGNYFQALADDLLPESAFARAIRMLDPVICFVVRGVGDAGETGCSAGPFLDYICVEATTVDATAAEYDPTVLPHEIGHALGLLHDPWDDQTNLMCANSSPSAAQQRGTNLSPFQESVCRSSPHVSYL
jgi:hypothetical protein